MSKTLVMKINFSTLLKTHQDNFAEADIALVQQSFEVARDVYGERLRLNGETILEHSLAVSMLLSEIGLDSFTVSAALLHDVLQTTDLSESGLRRRAEETVVALVLGLMGIKLVSAKSRHEPAGESLRRLILAVSKDSRVVLLRLAEKIDNLRTVSVLPIEKQKRAVRKAFDIYAPLAGRMGAPRFKRKLEDLAFRQLDPDAYSKIVEKLGAARKEREIYVEEACSILEQAFEERGLSFEVSGRAKHIYSIYKKLRRYQKLGKVSVLSDVPRIYDQAALRVLVGDQEDCYQSLDVINRLWKPLSEEFDDYIANPKPSGYRALHTTVYGPNGLPMEIQIKTYEMQKESESGAAAHSFYKEQMPSRAVSKKRIRWLQELFRWQESLLSGNEQKLSLDVFPDRVFVFTPKGDVRDLPKGATPIDFAYSVHSDLGDLCVAAKVDGKLASLDYELSTGEIVEIKTSSERRGPSESWLTFVKTAEARAHIRKALRN